MRYLMEKWMYNNKNYPSTINVTPNLIIKKVNGLRKHKTKVL